MGDRVPEALGPRAEKGRAALHGLERGVPEGLEGGGRRHHVHRRVHLGQLHLGEHTKQDSLGGGVNKIPFGRRPRPPREIGPTRRKLSTTTKSACFLYKPPPFSGTCERNPGMHQIPASSDPCRGAKSAAAGPSPMTASHTLCPWDRKRRTSSTRNSTFFSGLTRPAVMRMKSSGCPKLSLWRQSPEDARPGWNTAGFAYPPLGKNRNEKVAPERLGALPTNLPLTTPTPPPSSADCPSVVPLW